MMMSEQFPKVGGQIRFLLEQWNMNRPSLGSYVAFTFERLSSDWDGRLLTALRASGLGGMKEDCARLTHCRNEDFGHSTVVSAHRATEIVGMFSKVLVRLLNAVSCLRQFRIFVANALRYDGTWFTADGRLLCGSNLHHPTATVLLKGAAPTGHAVVIVDTEVITDLSPLVEIVTSPAGGLNVYKVYDKVGRNGIEFDLIPK